YNTLEVSNPRDLSNTDPTSNVTIENLTLDGNKSGVTRPPGGAADDISHNGVMCSQCQNIHIANVEAKNYWFAGVSFGNYTFYSVVNDLVTSGNGLPDHSYGGLLIQGQSSYNTVVNHTSDGDETGLWMSYGVKHNVVSGTYRNNYWGVILKDTLAGESYGNVIQASIASPGN